MGPRNIVSKTRKENLNVPSGVRYVLQALCSLRNNLLFKNKFILYQTTFSYGNTPKTILWFRLLVCPFTSGIQFWNNKSRWCVENTVIYILIDTQITIFINVGIYEVIFNIILKCHGSDGCQILWFHWISHCSHVKTFLLAVTWWQFVMGRSI